MNYRLKTLQVKPLTDLDKKVITANRQIVDFYKNRFPAQESQIPTQFGKLAVANGVTIDQAKYKVDDDEIGGLHPVELEANLSGSYVSLAKFINALERDDMFFIISSITLAGRTEGPDQAADETRNLSEGRRVVKLGIENRNQMIVAVAFGVVALLVIAYEFMPSSSTIASTTPVTTAIGSTLSGVQYLHVPGRITVPVSTAKKVRPAPDLDPTLHLQQLASAEQVTYEGSGRNIFISQPDAVIPIPQTNGTTDKSKPGGKDPIYTPPVVAQQLPIPLKFFGFASQPGESKKVFLSKDTDVFIAGEGEIVDRRYKVVRISATSVEIQDLVVSGPPQSIPLTQGNPS